MVNPMERDILPYISLRIKSILQKANISRLKEIEELRLRADKPLMMIGNGREVFIDAGGAVSANCRNSFIVMQSDIAKTLELISENSIYAYQEEIKNGFITLKGGHRVGIAGRVVTDGTGIKNIKDISGLNIRLSKQIKGCSKEVIKYILNNTGVYNTLIVSPPQCGKTTILRDITRFISDGNEELKIRGLKVGLVDERSEIAACYRGIAQNDVGIRTDTLDGCPKAAGMTLLLRSMSPQVIVTDEIGNRGDKEAIRQVINAGVKIITTAHGFNISELKTREEVLSLMEEKVFERYIVLGNSLGPGTLEEAVDGITMQVLYKRIR
ncbi:MAG: stage III sporulation protein AA [Clostridia bacterium]|nr:stage III sporulation protein AA [Clostridia bacterium]